MPAIARSGRRYAELFFRDDAMPLYADAARFKRAIARMRQRWGMRLDNDPYWSPNLAHHSGELGLAFPPRVRKVDHVAAFPGDTGLSLADATRVPSNLCGQSVSATAR